jgi:hypothetical protein
MTRSRCASTWRVMRRAGRARFRSVPQCREQWASASPLVRLPFSRAATIVGQKAWRQSVPDRHEEPNLQEVNGRSCIGSGIARMTHADSQHWRRFPTFHLKICPHSSENRQKRILMHEICVFSSSFVTQRVIVLLTQFTSALERPFS